MANIETYLTKKICLRCKKQQSNKRTFCLKCKGALRFRKLKV